MTPCLNSAQFLASTIESVLAQTYPDIEYLVVDGGSTDGSEEIARQHGVRVVHLLGSSQARAVNAGFREATGEYFAFLNADDVLAPTAIAQAVVALRDNPTAPFAYGNGRFTGADGADLGAYPVAAFNLAELEKACIICQPASLIRSSCFQAVGGLNEDLELALDYDLWFRLAADGARPAYVPHLWAYSRMHEGTKTFRERDRMYSEVIAMLQAHGRYVPFSWVHAYAGFAIDRRDQFFHQSEGSPQRTWLTLLYGIRANGPRGARFISEFCRETLRLWTKRRRRL